MERDERVRVGEDQGQDAGATDAGVEGRDGEEEIATKEAANDGDFSTPTSETI